MRGKRKRKIRRIEGGNKNLTFCRHQTEIRNQFIDFLSSACNGTSEHHQIYITHNFPPSFSNFRCNNSSFTRKELLSFGWMERKVPWKLFELCSPQELQKQNFIAFLSAKSVEMWKWFINILHWLRWFIVSFSQFELRNWFLSLLHIMGRNPKPYQFPENDFLCFCLCTKKTNWTEENREGKRLGKRISIDHEKRCRSLPRFAISIISHWARNKRTMEEGEEIFDPINSPTFPRFIRAKCSVWRPPTTCGRRKLIKRKENWLIIVSGLSISTPRPWLLQIARSRKARTFKH